MPAQQTRQPSGRSSARSAATLANLPQLETGLGRFGRQDTFRSLALGVRREWRQGEPVA